MILLLLCFYLPCVECLPFSLPFGVGGAVCCDCGTPWISDLTSFVSKPSLNLQQDSQLHSCPRVCNNSIFQR